MWSEIKSTKEQRVGNSVRILVLSRSGELAGENGPGRTGRFSDSFEE